MWSCWTLRSKIERDGPTKAHDKIRTRDVEDVKNWIWNRNNFPKRWTALYPGHNNFSDGKENEMQYISIPPMYCQGIICVVQACFSRMSREHHGWKLKLAPSMKRQQCDVSTKLIRQLLDYLIRDFTFRQRAIHDIRDCLLRNRAELTFCNPIIPLIKHAFNYFLCLCLLLRPWCKCDWSWNEDRAKSPIMSNSTEDDVQVSSSVRKSKLQNRYFRSRDI